jgi:hypothetical protein
MNMKNGKTFLKAAVLLLLVAGLVSLGSCKKKKVVPDAAALLKSGTWKIKTVTVDGADKLSMFTGMTLTFSATAYTSTNGVPVWPASGNWSINTDKTIVTRDDGVAVTIDNISETALGLSLNWSKTTLNGGRTESIPGKHVFTFTK